ncbi:uncharacterized protein Dwil_GK13661 [Drosophila willistoni]|uniref:GYF domain-containing protein n=1 Tax=Drosophila willistoni TaxID=7260 RepID=B4NHH9_DROWI|nr:GIGYF family protein Gyf [Drosophila willistoni]EDW83548.1 uncharacterized protein Dwil_GK13661 [Drosophila willistoni]
MTDSMKFGPEWLRNMSAEPLPATNSSNNGAGGGGSGLGSGAATNSAFATHSNTSTTIGSNSRNLFPEYRYGREEMLSLFDRNCLLPQILPSFKKLFVEKVQYPLALTPSSEDELNSQISIGSNSRPAWLQRSTGGFGTTSRGTGRGGAVDRGRMRGKSIYHPIFQRSTGIYDEGGLSSISMKPERNWSERNGTGDSVAIGPSTGGPIGAGGGIGVDWNGTPNSSPRKEFSSHHRNMENWRRSRNEDGSGDGPGATGSGSVGGSGISGAEVAGWRSSGGGGTSTNNASFASNTHRWGRSTSWRDEELNIDSSAGNIQRSISTIGTISNDRDRVAGGGGAKSTGTGVGGTGASNDNSRQLMSSKGNQSWAGCGSGGPDAEDNLPEWAMENPSELGGTFDASGAFHGDGDKHERGGGVAIGKTVQIRPQADPKEKLMKSSIEGSNDEQYTVSDGEDEANSQDPKTTAESIGSGGGNGTEPISAISNLRIDDSATDSPTESIVHGDISERFKEVADEVEKLIMDDDISVSQNQMRGLNEIEMNMRQHPPIGMQCTAPGTATAQHHQQPIPFSDQLTIQQHHQHHLQQQHLAMLTPTSHMMNANANDLWFYRDPQANVQGPFSAIEMTEWYRAGYFNENLFVRRFSDNRFRPLGELIKLCHGNMPFTNSHLLPSRLDVDNLQLPGIAAPVPVTIPVRPSSEEQHLQLKANVTAAADSLSAAIKGIHIGGGSAGHAIDNTTSHMLTMRFQMLQDQYIQHQEYQILADLSKNECFQRLSAIEREAVVRRKVQMLVLPEYLSSFSGLSNSLAVLNPIAGSQLYDAIAEQAKKDQQLPPVSNLLEANDFIVNAQLMHQQAQAQVQGQNQVPQPPASDPDKLHDLPGGSELDLLNEFNLRMLLRGQSSVGQQQQQPPPAPVPANPSSDFMTESQLMANQNLVMPMWLPSDHTPTQPQPNQQWPGMPNAKVTLWDVAALEEEQTQQQQLIQQQNVQQQCNSVPGPISSIETPNQIQVNNNQAHQDELKAEDSRQVCEDLEQRKDQQSAPESELSANQCSKQLLLPSQASKQQQPQQPILKVTEEDRRREQVEEKRRLKEERKRLQIEEEKRRALQVEEERSREIQEERERQQQIQAQRRKALLGNSAPVASPISGVGTGTSTKQQVSSKPGIGSDRERAPASSIAPWSLQAPNANNAAPGLAEIQKAERRERRADQQRQQEQLDKQMRATAAAVAEANDALLKWQSAPVQAPVMSLAEIQAEEAKRLATELLEQQRRRELEQQQSTLSANAGVAGGLSNIWGHSSKAWSGTASGSSLTASTSMSFWDESKHSAPVVASGTGPATVAAVLAAGLQPVNKSQSKSVTAVLPASRNLRKSQTLPSMQNVNLVGKAGKTAMGHAQEKTKVAQSKPGAKIATIGTEESKEKKPSTKGNQQGNDLESEFTGWCTKSLENMSAKVDVPTFVAFLQDLEAPYEVKDYVRIYLGEGKESADFAKQFLERRSKYKNLQRAQYAHNDDMCKPAPAITPSSNDNTDNKNKQKKIKKNKMTKMDARILGFSVTAAEGRINVGVRDFVDAP